MIYRRSKIQYTNPPPDASPEERSDKTELFLRMTKEIISTQTSRDHSSAEPLPPIIPPPIPTCSSTIFPRAIPGPLRRIVLLACRTSVNCRIRRLGPGRRRGCRTRWISVNAVADLADIEDARQRGTE